MDDLNISTAQFWLRATPNPVSVAAARGYSLREGVRVSRGVGHEVSSVTQFTSAHVQITYINAP